MRSPPVLMYRAGSRWRVSLAFLCSVGLFSAAICFGRAQSRPAIVTTSEEGNAVPGEISDVQLEPMNIPAEALPEPPPPDQISTDDVFQTEKHESKPVAKTWRPLKRTVGGERMRLGPAVGSPGAGLAVYAPRPDYPYEARRQNVIGSGVAGLTVDSETGFVVHAEMLRSTGKPVLDAAALRAFSRWRFRPGTSRLVQLPIVFTLTGASY